MGKDWKYKKLEEKTIEELISIIKEKDKQVEQQDGFIKMLATRNTILELKFEKESGGANANNYNQKWQWLDKLVFAVKSFNRPVKSVDILGFLTDYDYISKSWVDKPRCLSVHLNKAVRYRWLIPYKVQGIRGYFYILPEWFNEEGELLPEFKIILNYKNSE